MHKGNYVPESIHYLLGLRLMNLQHLQNKSRNECFTVENNYFGTNGTKRRTITRRMLLASRQVIDAGLSIAK